MTKSLKIGPFNCLDIRYISDEKMRPFSNTIENLADEFVQLMTETAPEMRDNDVLIYNWQNLCLKLSLCL